MSIFEIGDIVCLKTYTATGSPLVVTKSNITSIGSNITSIGNIYKCIMYKYTHDHFISTKVRNENDFEPLYKVILGSSPLSNSQKINNFKFNIASIAKLTLPQFIDVMYQCYNSDTFSNNKNKSNFIISLVNCFIIHKYYNFTSIGFKTNDVERLSCIEILRYALLDNLKRTHNKTINILSTNLTYKKDDFENHVNYICDNFIDSKCMVMLNEKDYKKYMEEEIYKLTNITNEETTMTTIKLYEEENTMTNKLYTAKVNGETVYGTQIAVDSSNRIVLEVKGGSSKDTPTILAFDEKDIEEVVPWTFTVKVLNDDPRNSATYSFSGQKNCVKKGDMFLFENGKICIVSSINTKNYNAKPFLGRRLLTEDFDSSNPHNNDCEETECEETKSDK